MNKELLKVLNQAEKEFIIDDIEEKLTESITTGNINTTLKITTKDGEKYSFQKINKEVFKRPDQVMENIFGIWAYLRQKVKKEHGNPSREVLCPIGTLDGKGFMIDENGNYWRMYDWIKDAITYDTIDKSERFKQAGGAFGKFHNRLADYPAEKLHEAIPDFHNTRKRFENFQYSVLEDKAGRLKAIAGQLDHPLKKAIDYILSCEKELSLLEDGKKTGKLPLRVTHNDTKINNVMFDNKTDEAICVIDLDTVGKGSVLEDVGDALRFACKVGEEPDSPKEAIMDEELFEAFIEGYLDETLVITEDGKVNENPKCGLIENEIDLMHKAPRILAMELGMRFIGDYLDGDVYFKRKEGQREDINLHRGLVQLHLAEDMKQKEEEMKEFIESYVQEKINEKNE